MSATTGLTGAVNSWGGTFNAAMLALLKPATFTADMGADALDATGFAGGAAIVRAKIKGLKSIRGSFGGYLATPVNGIGGGVSGAGYSTNVQRWDMALRCQPVETTVFPATNGWRTFLPGLVDISGSYDAIVDTSTTIKEAGSSSDPASATFAVDASNNFVASIITTGSQVVNRVGDLQVVRYTYEVNGNVQSVGTTNAIPAASTQATPVLGALELKLHEAGGSDKTLSVSAFWTSIRISVDPAIVTAVQVDFQGSDAVTLA
jgi:hypothetical protein